MVVRGGELGPRVKQRIVHSLTTELIPKQVAERLFEIEGEEAKLNAFKEFFLFVMPSKELALAQEFVDATKKTVAGYSKKYNHRIPEDLEILIKAQIADFKA